ncbi:dihydroxyacetone kinase subunit DhaK [Heyndrickxia acidiproducens]|uniref:dihydroxyacetone kinase subunit DhaK n=1 Tax=Heyndrickxia acidiproducens TaxID=1121084 RepID=UPI00037E3885|nr:dihydroxyacetone kinase subunit DhaK [Heyndrickxia acidiproducens]
MKKVINQPDLAVLEMVEGFLAAYPGKFMQVGNQGYGLVRNERVPNKVTIVIGGGSGHEPMFLGYIGDGLADGAAIGHVFAAPNPETVLETIRSSDTGAGTLLIYGNYAGDVLNFGMGEELANLEGIRTESVRVADDVASSPNKSERRGIAGDLFVMKIAGAAARAGYDLHECKRVAEKANAAAWSIGIGLRPGTNPVSGQPNFELPENEVEFGIGIHGEPGVSRQPMAEADVLTEKMLNLLFDDIVAEKGSELAVCINGLGSTTLMELYIVNRYVSRFLEAKGMKIHDTQIGNFCTTQEMGGFSISIMVLDPELRLLYDAPARAPYFVKGGC